MKARKANVGGKWIAIQRGLLLRELRWPRPAGSSERPRGGGWLGGTLRLAPVPEFRLTS